MVSTEQKLQLLKSGKLSAVDNVKQFLSAIDKDDQKGKNINAFLELNKNILEEAKRVDEKIKKDKAGKLAGLVISVKSNINTLGMKATCASKVLDNYQSTYDAAVIEKIRAEDGLIIGMTNMDEFACGGSGETSAFGPTKNPASLERITGGSSSGAAASVAAGFCDLALGSDTGGSIRNPASHCGVVGIKPSYGLVSRYGLIDLSMSLDQIGPLSQDVFGSTLLLSVIAGKDDRDVISQQSKSIEYSKLDSGNKIIVGRLKIKDIDSKIQKLIDVRVEEASKKYGWKIKDIDLSFVDLAIQTYYLLVYVEFFSGTRRFDGRRYGGKIEEACGPEVLRRILGGSEITKAEYGGKYYDRALKAKQLIADAFAKAFKDVDCIVMPTVPKLPHNIGEKISVESMYAYDALTIPANLAGCCALSLPAGKIDGVPVGLQLMSDKFEEQTMLSIASMIEKLG